MLESPKTLTQSSPLGFHPLALKYDIHQKKLALQFPFSFVFATIQMR